jgi:hypothetical protein
MKNNKAERFKNVSAQNIKEISVVAKCSEHYIRMIARGDREANSSKARAVLRALEKFENAVAKVKSDTLKELIIIGEND